MRACGLFPSEGNKVSYPLVRRVLTRKWWQENGHNVGTVAIAVATMVAFGVSRGILWKTQKAPAALDMLRDANLSAEELSQNL